MKIYRVFIAVLSTLIVSGCANTAIKGGSSLTMDTSPHPKHTATAELFVSHEYGTGEVNAGVRHMSDVSVWDDHGGVNGVFVEMRQDLVRF